MTTLEKAITIVFVLILVCVVLALVLLDVGPEWKTQLRLWKLQKCYDACAASHEIGTRGHQVCTDICLAEYCLSGEE